MKTFWEVNALTESQVAGYPLMKFIIIAFILNFAVGVIAFIIQPILPPQIPLYYGMAEAEKVVAPSWALILPSLTSSGILGINFLLGLVVEDEFLKKTLILAGVASSFFSTIATLKIVFLFGNL